MYKYGETQCEGMGRCHQSFARVTYQFLAEYLVRRNFAERNDFRKLSVVRAKPS